jgi:hypothetical protein
MCFRSAHQFDRQPDDARVPETSVPPRVRRLVGATIAAVAAVAAAWTLPDMLNAKATAPQSAAPAAVQPETTTALATQPGTGSTAPVQPTALVADDEVAPAPVKKAWSGPCDH